MTSLSLDRARQLAKTLPSSLTPLVVMDSTALSAMCRSYQNAFHGMEIYFSVKANNQPGVLKIFLDNGLGFDVASWNEIEILKANQTPPERIIYSAPIKKADDIARAFEFGVRTFVFDSMMELEKLARNAPGAALQLRLVVGNEGSDWPLERKFGVEVEEGVGLMLAAADKGMLPAGVTFHVGSQNRDPQAWGKAIEKAGMFYERLEKKGLSLSILDVGGGYPAQYGYDLPDLTEYAQAIRSAANQHFPESTRIFLEPGRGLVGPAGVLLARVVSRAQRGDEDWLYVDAGVFHGLIEARDGFRFPIHALRESDDCKPYVVSGATCDSADVIQEGVILPADLDLDDRVLIFSAGAYVNALEKYNGYPFPPSRLV